MNPIQVIITAMAALITGLKEKANTALKGLPELEKLEVGQEVLGALRSLNWAKEDIERFLGEFGEQFTKLDETLEAHNKDVLAAGIAAALANSALVKKEDHDAQIKAAREQGKTDAETQFAAQREQAKEVAARRKSLVESLGAIASEVLSDEDLAAEDHEVRVQKMKSRREAVLAAGLSEKKNPEAVKNLLSIALDDEGEVEFQARLKGFEEVLAGAPKGGKPKAPADTTLVAGSGGTGQASPGSGGFRELKGKALL